MNTLLTSTKILRQATRILKNTLGMARAVPKQYSEEFAKTGAKIGYTVNVRKPPRYKGRLGQAAQLEATKDSFTPLSLTTQFGVDLPFSMADRTLSLDKFTDNIIKPAVATIANKVDDDLCQLGEQIFNAVGAPGTTPTSLQTFLDAGALLSDMGTPRDDERYCMLTPQMHASAVGSNLGIFNPANTVSEQYRTGMLARFGGFKFYEDQNQPSHTIGNFAGTPLVNGASQTGSSLVIDGCTAGVTMKKGDIFTIGSGSTGVYSVNPQNRRSTGRLQQFVATADATADGSGNMTIPISPAIVPAGQFQNVDSAPANNAAITLAGTASATNRYGLAFHKDFATIAFADLELPSGVHEASRVSDPDSGISMSLISAYDVMSGQMITRLEVLYGMAVVYPELACRIWQA